MDSYSYFDLNQLFHEVNFTFFSGLSTARIRWGKGSIRRYQRSIQLGVYDFGLQEIRIHPCLNHPNVPEYYIKWVIYHELLHEVLGVEHTHKGQRVFHSDTFRALESCYPYYEQAVLFEKKWIQALLRGRC